MNLGKVLLEHLFTFVKKKKNSFSLKLKTISLQPENESIFFRFY